MFNGATYKCHHGWLFKLWSKWDASGLIVESFYYSVVYLFTRKKKKERTFHRSCKGTNLFVANTSLKDGKMREKTVEWIRHGGRWPSFLCFWCSFILFILFNILLPPALMLYPDSLILTGSSLLIVIVTSAAFISIYNVDPQWVCRVLTGLESL